MLKKQIKIAPSLLSADFCAMGEAMKNLKAWGADYAHCDVMDGVFVPNLTFGMPMVKALKKCAQIPLDVHLMIVKPEKYVMQFADAGADIITFHPDASEKTGAALKEIKARGIKCGLVLNPDKPLSLIEPYLELIDMLVIMSVYAGFGGQSFIRDSLAKIGKARALLNAAGRSDVDIEVDGGVGEGNAADILSAGANVLVAGSAVFGSPNPPKTISALRGALG
ncbi:MAG: ribulose-phosphate 3-epimerase [Clostridiaceae bacterium]|jgi:ribulose-phosphate 3-epimerase|nr:ribulose-phosphate 3-epimerase [Clostridiaceae bacterium]